MAITIEKIGEVKNKLGEGPVWDVAEKANVNPKDPRNQPVWNLPPTLRLGQKDRAKYLAIGESDRMTLKFAKGDPSPRGLSGAFQPLTCLP